jgi:hypothetical protein
MESEDIYGDMYGEYRHRHLNQCICFLGARIHTLEWALRKITERWGNLRGNWEDTASDMYDLAHEALK